MGTLNISDSPTPIADGGGNLHEGGHPRDSGLHVSEGAGVKTETADDDDDDDDGSDVDDDKFSVELTDPDPVHPTLPVTPPSQASTVPAEGFLTPPRRHTEVLELSPPKEARLRDHSGKKTTPDLGAGAAFDSSSSDAAHAGKKLRTSGPGPLPEFGPGANAFQIGTDAEDA